MKGKTMAEPTEIKLRLPDKNTPGFLRRVREINALVQGGSLVDWWTRVGPFYRQAVEQFVGEMPSESDMQERLDSIAKRFCTGARVAVKMNQGADVVSGGIARMDELIAVFREVVETGTHAHVC
jgi:hypothetical protein